MTSGDTPKSLERFNSKSLKTQGEVLLRRQRGCRKGQTTEMVRRERGRERKRKSERDRNTESPSPWVGGRHSGERASGSGSSSRGHAFFTSSCLNLGPSQKQLPLG